MSGELLVATVRMLVALVAVLALAVVLLRHVLPRLGGARQAGRQLRLLEVHALDRQHKIARVEARGEELLLGVGAGSVTLLRSWPVGAADVAPADDPRPASAPAPVLASTEAVP